MKSFKFLTIFIVLTLALALLFVSCDKTGDETIAAPETTLAPSVTDTPTEPPEETTEAPHVHVWGELVIVKAPTCTEEGQSEQSCACGEKQTFTEKMIAHIEGAWVKDKAATCTEAGAKHVECTMCKTTLKNETIPAAGHTDGAWIVDKEATETIEGSRHLECSVCKATLKTEVVPVLPHTHSFGTWNTVKVASCTEEGVRERVCSCGEKETEPLAKLAHSESAWITDKKASCTDAGSKHTECEVCKTTIKTESIPAEGHTDGDWIIDKEASATSDGSKHLECSVCKATLKTEVIPATPHTPGAWIVDKEPTCTETGLRHRACTKCGETVDTETISAKGHTEVIDAAKAATCTETGLTEGKHCSVCKAVTVAQEIVPVKAHTEVIDPAKESTCTETGLTEGKHCSVCNAITKAQEIIPVKAHTEVIDEAKEATCTKAGLTEGSHCSVCNALIKPQVPTPLKAHTEVVDGAKEATCTETGLTEGKHCSVCNAVIKAQETVPVKAHTEVVDAAKEATCTEAGLTEGKHCSVCNAVLKAQETVPVKAHTESDWIVDKAATTAEEGSKHIECTVCKAVIKTEAIPKVEIPKIEYTITVVDGKGNALSGIEVIFTKAGAELSKVVTDNSGKATVKLESGDYGFELAGVDSYYVSCGVSTLTASASSASVRLIPYASSPELVYPGQEDKEPANGNPGIIAGVYTLDIGSYRISVEKDKMRYVFFRPTEGGYYRFYTDSDKVEVGYYGGSFFVSNNNTGTMLEDGTMEVKVLRSSVGNTLVIGIKSTSAAVTECTLTIEKHSDVEISIEELEWVPYKPDAVFEKIETPEGYIVGMDLAVLTPLDPAYSEIQVFFNEKDGYYHLESADGPVLYVRIGSKSSYQEAFTTIVGTSNLGKYIYDENGEFVRKERYNEIFFAYADAADSKYSVYPLDEDLYYILKGLGEIGWYDRTSYNYIFKEEEIIVMPYNGWLFACVYFK